MLSDSAIANRKKMATRKMKFAGVSNPRISEMRYGIIGRIAHKSITKSRIIHRKEYFIVSCFRLTSRTITEANARLVAINAILTIDN